MTPLLQTATAATAESTGFFDWSYIFGYLEKAPMIFTTGLFWYWFALVLVITHGLRNKPAGRNLFLLVFSLFFYWKSSGIYFILLIVSTLIDYSIGWKIFRSDSQGAKKRWLALSVVANLLLLFYYKYTGFLTGIFNDVFGTQYIAEDLLAKAFNGLFNGGLNIEEIILPAGISFFTFQTISYSVDIYRGRIAPVKSILDFGFYVAYFPQLVAGPIVRAAEFVPQITQPSTLTERDYKHSVFLIFNGLIKKILISDYISANFVDRPFADPLAYSGLENLFAVYGFALQIYCDFSGYTDIAIGTSRLLGFKLPLNFDSPYKSASITEFWRRWHISLSSWLKDYLYIPLGGNRKGKVRQYVNLFLTMLLGGLWHGRTLMFLIWGAMHGLALALHKLWMHFFPIRTKVPAWSRILGLVITFHFVCFCWIFFRAQSVVDPTTGAVLVTDMQIVGRMLDQIAYHFNLSIFRDFVVGYWPFVLLLSIGFVIHWLPNSVKTWYREGFYRLPDVVIALLAILMIVGLYQIKTAETQSFIYFKF